MMTELILASCTRLVGLVVAAAAVGSFQPWLFVEAACTCAAVAVPLVRSSWAAAAAVDAAFVAVAVVVAAAVAAAGVVDFAAVAIMFEATGDTSTAKDKIEFETKR